MGFFLYSEVFNWPLTMNDRSISNRRRRYIALDSLLNLEYKRIYFMTVILIARQHVHYISISKLELRYQVLYSCGKQGLDEFCWYEYTNMSAWRRAHLVSIGIQMIRWKLEAPTTKKMSVKSPSILMVLFSVPFLSVYSL